MGEKRGVGEVEVPACRLVVSDGRGSGCIKVPPCRLVVSDGRGSGCIKVPACRLVVSDGREREWVYKSTCMSSGSICLARSLESGLADGIKFSGA